MYEPIPWLVMREREALDRLTYLLDAHLSPEVIEALLPLADEPSTGALRAALSAWCDMEDADEWPTTVGFYEAVERVMGEPPMTCDDCDAMVTPDDSTSRIVGWRVDAHRNAQVVR